MKKILCLFICFALCVCFALPAFASQTIINGKNYTNLSMYNYVESGFSEHTIQEYIDSARSLSSMSEFPYYFAYPYGVNNNGSGKVLVICSKVSKLEFDTDTRTLHTSSRVSNDFGIVWTYNVGSTSSGVETVSGFSVPDDFPLEKLYDYTNMTFENVSRPFDPQMPPPVFTYSVDKNNFSLQNGEQGAFNVTISYTNDYIEWVQQVKEELLPDFNGSYNFLLYVSKTRAVDIDTLKQSLQDMSFVKLTYNDYYTAQKDNYTAYNWLNNDDYMLNRGADLVFSFDPLKQQSITIPCLSENIQGEQSHIDGFVTVLGAYCDGKLNPDCFSLSWFEKTLNELYQDNTGLSVAALNGDVAPNDRYVYYYSSDNSEDNSEDNREKVLMRQFFVPYALIGSFKCDLYNGGYTYKLQTVNGKDYLTPTDTSQKPSPEFQQHSSFEDKSNWLSPEDARKYYNEWLKKNQYNEDFDFNADTFKDVFSKEGDFFKFIGSVFSVFPSYIMSIFVAFLVCMLVIVLLKFIL